MNAHKIVIRSTDTISLISLHDQASGVDIPPELLSRHVSTDTRTLISIRDNFSTTIPIIQNVLIDAQTQSTSAIQHDASSNTLAPAEQRHTGVQVCIVIDFKIQDNDPICFRFSILGSTRTTDCTKHNTTSTEARYISSAWLFTS